MAAATSTAYPPTVSDGITRRSYPLFRFAALSDSDRTRPVKWPTLVVQLTDLGRSSDRTTSGRYHIVQPARIQYVIKHCHSYRPSTVMSPIHERPASSFACRQHSLSHAASTEHRAFLHPATDFSKNNSQNACKSEKKPYLCTRFREIT